MDNVIPLFGNQPKAESREDELAEEMLYYRSQGTNSIIGMSLKNLNFIIIADGDKVQFAPKDDPNSPFAVVHVEEFNMLVASYLMGMQPRVLENLAKLDFSAYAESFADPDNFTPVE